MVNSMSMKIGEKTLMNEPLIWPDSCQKKTRDMECYQDADGNVYDFAFGMNRGGVIDDARVKKYK